MLGHGYWFSSVVSRRRFAAPQPTGSISCRSHIGLLMWDSQVLAAWPSKSSEYRCPDYWRPSHLGSPPSDVSRGTSTFRSIPELESPWIAGATSVGDWAAAVVIESAGRRCEWNCKLWECPYISRGGTTFGWYPSVEWRQSRSIETIGVGIVVISTSSIRRSIYDPTVALDRRLAFLLSTLFAPITLLFGVSRETFWRGIALWEPAKSVNFRGAVGRV